MRPVCTATVAKIDYKADVGADSSLAIGTDGLGLISYFDFDSGNLKVAHCDALDCSTATFTALDTAGNVGQHTSITIGIDKKPVISYYDESAAALKVAKCGNLSCSGGNRITTVDDPPNNDVGQYTSIALGSDGLPVVSYHDQTNFHLKVLHCGDATCTSGNVITSPDTAGNVGLSPSLRLDGSESFDLTGLEINYSRHLSEIKLPPDVRVLEHGDATLVTIVPPSGYAEEMKAAAEAAAAAAAAAAAVTEAGAAPAEGAPAAAPGAAAPAAAAAPSPEKK